MKFKSTFLTLFISFTILFVNDTFAQSLDSETLVKELENSNNNIFKDYLKRYDDYLKQHPTDITIQIEKCKFLQNAQYDEEEDYNPNQEAFDSCSAALVELHPNHPEVLIFQTTYLWGDELKEVFATAQTSIQKNPKVWSDSNLGILYKSMSDQYFSDSEYNKAYSYMLEAISKDKKYKSTIDYAQILIELKKKEEALKVLLSVKESSLELWELTQKADMLLELKAYSKALQLYNKISKIDSTYNNNLNIATTLEKVGQIELARKCLVSDTASNWQKEDAIRNLLMHDIKYENGAKCIDSYNKYRDLGYSTDPLGIYRLKVFFLHPLQIWSFRDIFGVLMLLIVILLLILIPSIWILPFYFIGHKWNFLARDKPFESDWGLKSFWFVSYGYLIASFTTFFVEPELLYSIFSSSYFDGEVGPEKLGLTSIIFILILALFGLASLYKTNPKVLMNNQWSIKKSIFTSLGILLAFRIVSGIYMQIGVNFFDVTIDNFATIPQLFLASQQEIEALIAYSGKGITFLLICLLAPLYEEIIFRGVILGSCQRYSNFHIANFFQAILFAVIHMDLFLFPVFLLFGIVTGILRKKSGGLLPGIIFHVVNNTLAILILLLK